MEVPQLNLETGLSEDYINEYWGLSIAADRGESGYLIACIKERPKKHYSQRYNPKKYSYDPNNPRIKELDQIADSINQKAKEGTLGCKEFLQMAMRVESIVKGT